MEFGCANEVPMQTTSLEGGPRASTTPCGFRSSPSPQVRTCPRLTLAGFRGLPVPISCSCVLRFIIREACLYGTSRALRISTHPVSRLSFTRDRPVGYGDKVPVTPLGRILAYRPSLPDDAIDHATTSLRGQHRVRVLGLSVSHESSGVSSVSCGRPTAHPEGSTHRWITPPRHSRDNVPARHS